MSTSYPTRNSSLAPRRFLTHEQRQLLHEVVKRGLVLPTNEWSELRYQEDPVPFVRDVLGADPWERQVQILQAVGQFRRVTVRSCHHSGKTWTAAALTHWFLRAFDPALVLTTAPTERQVKEVLWYEIAQQHHRARLGGILNTLTLEVSPTQRAIGMTTNTPERFQGWHCPNILVIVDEASGVPEPIYEALEGVLTSTNAHLLLIGNPNYPSGTFFESFKSPLYEKFHISAADVPEHLLPPHWLEERKTVWGEESPVYQVRVMGNFPVQGENSLFSLTDVEEAMRRGDNGSDSSGDCEIGADIARYGTDWSVAIVRRGRAVLDLQRWRGSDTMASAGHIAQMARAHGAALVKVDDVGVGGGVVDRLAEEGFPVVGVNVGESAWDSEKFANRRAELYFGLAQRFRDGDISLPEDDNLLSQLVAMRYLYSPRGQFKLPSKEDMRKERSASLSWRSPDEADALMLAFATVSSWQGGQAVAGAPREGW
jgi:hypothetical protein